MKAPILEYRLRKGNDTFEAIYHYRDIELEQILARRECEFFVKEGITYRQLSSAIEGDLFIIYVETYEEEPLNDPLFPPEGLVLEIRELNQRKNNPILKIEHHDYHLDILSVIGSVYYYIDEVEWERDSAEIDEDRYVYILYVKATGYKLEEERK
ncbi:hypothetical protein B0G93_107122 [Bacillus sp. V-88]|jgi:hypothetical protein|uniref:hypothetical protein n=1 Tax=Rossellomorea vietnamensis TaxID=218284 RepID=UPI00054F514E|nr:hypothetical protein [Rossellomorea vietnamensis]OXS60841.1 hypothetical protein B1B00_09855 [Bacillus sp. DSM 27956]PRX76834.1 hypothetical protein B0G93_107122 [Bacillus sp. V-88]SLK22072.1 hypothetical protein SAMN06295884_107122 [Bacillus sp. V-88]